MPGIYVKDLDVTQNILAYDKHAISSAQLWKDSEKTLIINDFCYFLFASVRCTWVHDIRESSQPLQCFCSTALRHLVYDLTVCSAITCLNSELIGPSSTARALTYIFCYHTLLAPSHCLMASWTPRCLCPLSAVCFIPPDFLTSSLLLFLWL